jgi:hypothetical protein
VWALACVCGQASRLSTPPSLRLDDGAVEELIRWYCRESGVRNLEKHVEKLFRKIALRVARRVEETAAKTAPLPVTAATAAPPQGEDTLIIGSSISGGATGRDCVTCKIVSCLCCVAVHAARALPARA